MDLERLNGEWLNKDHPDMQDLRCRVLQLKARYTYEQNWLQLSMRRIRRTARNPDYVARLLYLVDCRPMPIVPLQPTVFLDQGHLYRTLERAGVEYRAVTSRSVRIEDDFLMGRSGLELWIDPAREIVVIGGEAYPFGARRSPVDVVLEKSDGDNDETYRVVLNDNAHALPANLPVLRRK